MYLRYRSDFDRIKGNFLLLHHQISKILSTSDHVTLENLKELLAIYSVLEGPLQAAETITSVMRIVQQHSSVINCSYLEQIADHFLNTRKVREKYMIWGKKLVDVDT